MGGGMGGTSIDGSGKASQGGGMAAQGGGMAFQGGGSTEPATDGLGKGGQWGGGHDGLGCSGKGKWECNEGCGNMKADHMTGQDSGGGTPDGLGEAPWHHEGAFEGQVEYVDGDEGYDQFGDKCGYDQNDDEGQYPPTEEYDDDDDGTEETDRTTGLSNNRNGYHYYYVNKS
eukprot:5163393-Karenia_brevis.AAC.1